MRIMKSIPLAFCFFLLLMVAVSSAYSDALDNYSLLAWYPLSSDAIDKTGNNGGMVLVNTPFQGGGIYCNGNYVGGNPGPCNATTPSIVDFDFSSFAISVAFKIDQIYDERRPVIVCGDSWRWMSVFIDAENYIGFEFNDTFFNAQSTQIRCSENTWHVATVTYDGETDTGKLYLDDTLIDSMEAQINHNNNNNFTITHPGVGRVFLGNLKDLKIYEKSSSSSGGGGGGCFIKTALE